MKQISKHVSSLNILQSSVHISIDIHCDINPYTISSFHFILYFFFLCVRIPTGKNDYKTWALKKKKKRGLNIPTATKV